MRVIALIDDPGVIRRILEHLGLWAPEAIGVANRRPCAHNVLHAPRRVVKVARGVCPPRSAYPSGE